VSLYRLIIMCDDLFSAAGKILRRELRDRAKEELAGRDPHDDHANAKL
jgi:4-coumarate--CoA ligase